MLLGETSDGPPRRTGRLFIATLARHGVPGPGRHPPSVRRLTRTCATVNGGIVSVEHSFIVPVCQVDPPFHENERLSGQ